MSDESLRIALAVAARHIDDPTTSESERESILIAISERLAGAEAELAARVLHHLRQGAALQQQMHELLAETDKAKS